MTFHKTLVALLPAAVLTLATGTGLAAAPLSSPRRLTRCR